MNNHVLMLLCLLLAAYAAFTVVFYWVRLRPRLHGASGPSSATRSLAGPEEGDRAGAKAQPAPSVNPALESSLEDWHYTLDAIVDPVLILDLDLIVVKGNLAAVQLLSVNGSAIEGKFCYQLFAGSDMPCRLCPLDTVRLENKPYRQEMTQRYLGRTFAVSCSPLINRGEIVGFVYSAKDISHQRNLEKRLVHAHKLEAIATLAGGIAHDFNNILGAILGNADLLLYRLPAEDEREAFRVGPPITTGEIIEHVQAVKRAGSRAKELVGQILAFSRQSSNQRKNLLIAPVVKESCRLLRATLPSTLELKVSVAENIGMIYADPGQIQQVVMNLCANAAQAMDKKPGVIEISLREIETGMAEQQRYHDLEPGNYVVLTVGDSGKGIPPEMLERIFDPFFTTREVGAGSGMGLAVLHGIIVSHDGVIDVKSKPGKGTVFTVFFPRVRAAGVEEDDQLVAMPRGTETILFVDDEEDIVKMRTRMLSYLGYRVLPATGPEQALGYFTRGRHDIDLLITDHTMPRMTGLELAKEINGIRPELPIILCSGYSEAVTPEEALQAGVRRFLAKPVDMRLLALAIREILPNRDRGNHENFGH